MPSLPPARITRPAKGECKYAKQTGGRGQYAHVKIQIYPGRPGSGFVFQCDVVGGAIPKEFVPAIEHGLRAAAKMGTVDGGRIQDVRVVLDDGSYHDIDSSESAFWIAASMAFQDAVNKAAPITDFPDDDHASFVSEPWRPTPAPRPSAIALPEPDDD